MQCQLSNVLAVWAQVGLDYKINHVILNFCARPIHYIIVSHLMYMYYMQTIITYMQVVLIVLCYM